MISVRFSTRRQYAAFRGMLRDRLQKVLSVFEGQPGSTTLMDRINASIYSEGLAIADDYGLRLCDIRPQVTITASLDDTRLLASIDVTDVYIRGYPG